MPISFWILFNAVILVLLVLDLAVMSRGRHAVGFKQAMIMSAFWIGLAIGFAVFVHQWLGPGKALEFMTGYLLEEALSVDNLFVFILLFAYFKVPPEQEKSVLFWGIIGALIMRGLFIYAGVTLVQRFHWILYVFGVFLIYTGIQLMFGGDKDKDPSNNIVLRFSRRFLPLSDSYDGGRFITRRSGKLLFTPLFVVLLVVETTDILFAVDSIPAFLYRLHLKRLCHPGAAFNVFRAGRHDEALPLPELRTCPGADFYWDQDDAARALSRAHMGGAAGDCRAAGGFRAGVRAVSEEGRSCSDQGLIRKGPGLERDQQGKLLFRRQAGGIFAACGAYAVFRQDADAIHVLIG
jgi:TerC family integral membrane protein